MANAKAPVKPMMPKSSGGDPRAALVTALRQQQKSSDPQYTSNLAKVLGERQRKRKQTAS